MPLVTSLARAHASDLERVRQKIRLSQATLAKGARVSQGTVWNFLHRHAIRADHAERIYHQVASVAEQEIRNRRLHNDDVVFIRKILAEIRLAVEGKTKQNVRIAEGFKSSSLASSHLTELVMALTDTPRLNLTKSFDYFHPEHFRKHVHCVGYGIKYRWLAYETSKIATQWESTYIKPLVSQLVHELQWDEQDVRKLVRERVECHVFPKIAQRIGQLIPFRIVIFENEVCLCTEEPQATTYPQGQTILMRPPTFSNVQKTLDQLYFACPSIGSIASESYREQVAMHRDEILHLHKTLRAEFLHAVLANTSNGNENVNAPV